MKSSQKGFIYHLVLCVATLQIGDRDRMESTAGIKWNQWPGSNGMGGRNGMESVAGIIWNTQLAEISLGITGVFPF